MELFVIDVLIQGLHYIVEFLLFEVRVVSEFHICKDSLEVQILAVDGNTHLVYHLFRFALESVVLGDEFFKGACKQGMIVDFNPAKSV